MTARPERRIDPKGKAALFQTGVVAPPDHLKPGREKQGKDALYSSGPPQPGTVVVTCQRCRVRTRASLAELGIRLLPSVWWPIRHYSHLMRCPSCGRFCWCNVAWTD